MDSLPKKWSIKKLSELADFIGGVSYDPEDITSSGIRVLRGGNIQSGEILQKPDDVFLPESYSNNENQIRKFDTIVVASTGSIEALAKAATCFTEMHSTQIGAFLRIIRPKEEKYAMLVSAWCTSQHFRNYIISRAKGTSINNIRTDFLSDFEIPVPDEEELSAISKLYLSINEKILLNRQIIADAYSMAKQLYEYWFMQFDFPNDNGSPYKSSGGKLIYDPLVKREIPQTWSSSSLISILDILKDGTHNPPKRCPKGVPLLTGTMFGNFFLDYSKATYIEPIEYEEIHKKYQPQENDIILTKIGTIGYVNILRKNDIPITIHCNSALLRFKKEYSGPYSLFLCKSPLFFARLYAKKGQSIQEFVSLEKIADIAVECPPENIIRMFNEQVNPLMKELECKQGEIEFLNDKIRDLVPFVLNGQIKCI